MWKMVLIEIVGMWSVLYIAALTAPWFIYIGVLVILFVVLVVVGGKEGIKGVGASILVFIVSLVGFNYFYNYTCGPSSADVKVMKPMAQKISDYIVKNGIPESLKDIPDLPYGFTCKPKHEEFFEECSYSIGKKNYHIGFAGGSFLHIDTSKHNGMTRVSTYYAKDENGKILLDEPVSAYLVFGTGICSTMKQ